VFSCFIIGDPISDLIAVYCNDLMWCEPRTTSATFFGSISAKLPTNTCPGGGSQHMVSHSRKFLLRDQICWKTLFFRVPYLWSAYGSWETFCSAYTATVSAMGILFFGKFWQIPWRNLWNSTKFCSTYTQIPDIPQSIGIVVLTDNTSNYKEFIVTCNSKTHYIRPLMMKILLWRHVIHVIILIIIIKVSL